MEVKWIGFAIGLAGTIVGGITAYLETGNFFQGIAAGSPYWTIAVITVGCLASLLLLWKTRLAAWILLCVAVLGVFGNYVMWEGPGSFFLVSALIGLTHSKAKPKTAEAAASVRK
ncbi:hypothetical protein JZ785_24415 [Alicyclobacillus curvatus]|jgi:4-amino-4-deoxy-L-arabinose transferase-like glycosyltransferase|nr:hypothetical protein JZ785_24415 [Alicyclobacillus curvatus]